MLVKEFYKTREDGVNLYINYDKVNEGEDQHYIIQQPTEIEYDVAIDIEDAPYTYRLSENIIEDK